MRDKNTRVLFLSHGGGPLPLLGDEGHREMLDNLKMVVTRFSKPSAIIVISAHWEEKTPTITSGTNPPLIYDYGGFPKSAYDIKYPCPGEPDLADQIYLALATAGIEAALDELRGFDHGVFVPLKLMYPEADVPCVQISLVNGLSPDEHMRIGQALSAVKYENLLVIGSGFSFHNMQAFFTPDTEDTKAMNESFQQWLIDTCSDPGIGEVERTKRLADWEHAPFARYCHPREEHLLPLHVCYGIAETASREFYEISIIGKKSSVFLW